MRLRARKRKTHLDNAADLFLVGDSDELFRQQIDQTPMHFFDFLISQSPIIGAILEPQGDRPPRLWDIGAFVGANQGDLATLRDLLVTDCSDEISKRCPARHQQSHVAHYGWIARERLVLDGSSCRAEQSTEA